MSSFVLSCWHQISVFIIAEKILKHGQTNSLHTQSIDTGCVSSFVLYCFSGHLLIIKGFLDNINADCKIVCIEVKKKDKRMLWTKNMAQLQTPVRHGDVFLILQKRRLGASSLRGERTCDICFSKGREGKEKSKKVE